MGKVNNINAPENLTAKHDLAQFCSDEPSLNLWLKTRSFQNEQNGASRTFVVCNADRVIGFYALSASAVAREETSTRIKRNMPDPIPVILIGRLAVDKQYQHQGIGSDLLRDALLRALQAGKQIGVRAILVNAISENAKRFYEKYGFIASPINPYTLMITMSEASSVLHAQSLKNR